MYVFLRARVPDAGGMEIGLSGFIVQMFNSVIHTRERWWRERDDAKSPGWASQQPNFREKENTNFRIALF